MMLRPAALTCLLLGLATVAACGKKPETESAAAPQATAPQATVPAPAATTAPAPQDEAALLQAAEKKAAVERAMKEQALLDEPKGQWATSASASSTYAADKAPASTAGYTPMRATGKPDVEHYGDSDNGWATEKTDAGIEWLELGFAKPVNATEIRIRQNNAPGAIVKLELIDEAGAKHTVWEGLDETAYEPRTFAWFSRSFERTAYKAKGARITLATNAVPGWNEIDAVQLIGE